MISVTKRGKVYQYQFDIAPSNGKRKRITKSGFETRKKAEEAGIKSYNEYNQTGQSFTPSMLSYSDYLNYWMKKHCEVNLKYHTIEAYKSIVKNHVKPSNGC